jgi:CO/xanthine dehydrogenase Mo-binding subunit
MRPFTYQRAPDAVAGRFGWSRRDPNPGSMHDGDWLVGWGTAATTDPSNIAACAARVTNIPMARRGWRLPRMRSGRASIPFAP